MFIRRAEDDLAALFRRRFGRVLDQVEEHLHQLVLVAEHRRQGGVVVLDELHVAAEPVLGQAAGAVEYLVDVDRFALQRAAVGEHVHAIDQAADTVRLVADEAGQRLVLGLGGLLQQLGGAANPRQGVLDLMGQHGGHGGDRAGGTAMGELAVDLVGDGAFLQGHHHPFRPLRHRRRLDVDEMPADARRLQEHAVLGDGVAVAAHLVDEGEQRTVRGQHIVQPLTPQVLGAAAEELFGGAVEVDDGAVRVDHDDGRGQGVEHQFHVHFRGLRRLLEGDHGLLHHAAIASMTPA